MCIYWEKRSISHTTDRHDCATIRERIRAKLQLFIVKYTKLLHNWYSGLFSIAILATYLTLAARSLAHSVTTMDHRNLMARNNGWVRCEDNCGGKVNRLQREIANMSLLGVRETNAFLIIVNQPPDFHTAENRRLLNDLVNIVKSHERNKVKLNSINLLQHRETQAESAIFWLPEYMRYIQYERRSTRNTLATVDGYDSRAVPFLYRELPYFVNQSNTLWSDMLRLNDVACEEES